MLKDSGIEAFADHLIESKCSNIIVLTGAGISTAAGYLNLIRIPDFRTKGTGLYSNLKKYNLPYPEAIFDINYFMRKPHAFYELARELYPGKFKPTKCHLFVKSLSDSELLLRNYTQNIDMLERLAEIPEDLIVESHGSFNKATCVGYSTRLMESSLAVPPIEAILLDGDKITAQETATAPTTHNDSKTIPSALNEHNDSSSSSDNDDELDLINGCRKEYSLHEFKSFLNTNSLPRCECKGLIKPNITFFGENLPFDFYRNLESDFQKCDALIVIGTSLQVHPFAGLIDMVKSNVPRLLINRELAGNFKQNVTNTSGFYRDAIYLGDCDQGVEILAKRLGISLNVDDDLANEIQKLGI